MSSNKEVLAAFLCVKPSVAEDLSTPSELKQALQYAGYNPSQKFIDVTWKDLKSETVSFKEFCSITENMAPVTASEIESLLTNMFSPSDRKISISEFASVIDADVSSGVDSSELLKLLEGGGVIDNGNIDCDRLINSILGTIKDIRNLSVQKLEKQALDQRINSKTFTKRKYNKYLCVQNSEASSGIIDNLKDWKYTCLKGTFYVDKLSVICHQYSLDLADLGNTVVKIKPLNKIPTPHGPKLNDSYAFIFREGPDGTKTYIGFTNQRGSDDSFYWVDLLKEGKYLIVPFTSGCILRYHSFGSTGVKLLKSDNPITLSDEMLAILKEIFCQIDLDDNGYLNRQEFNLYNWRTSGEEVQDDEWEVVQQNFDIKDAELTSDGFVALHQMEAEDNGGNVDDMWVSLRTLGYNGFGVQDQAATFVLSVHSMVCQPSLAVCGLRSGGLLLDKAVVRSVMELGEAIPLKDSDIIKYVYMGQNRSTVVVQNRSNRKASVLVDCSGSINCITNRPNLKWKVEVEGRSAIVAHHLLGGDDDSEWSVVCTESILEH